MVQRFKLIWPSYNMEPWKTGVTFHKSTKMLMFKLFTNQYANEKGMRLVDLSISAMKEAQKICIKL